MAADGPPIVVEPESSGKSNEAGTSLAPSSPANSLNSGSSSVPESANTSTTTPSDSSSPVENKNHGRLSNAPTLVSQSTLPAPLTPPTFDHLPSSTLQPVNNGERSTPRSVPQDDDNLSANDDRVIGRHRTWWASLRARTRERRWVEQFIGLFSLGVALWLGIRTYKMAVWSMWNDHVQTCLQYIQVCSCWGQGSVGDWQNHRLIKPFRWVANGFLMSNLLCLHIRIYGEILRWILLRSQRQGLANEQWWSSYSIAMNLRWEFIILTAFWPPHPQLSLSSPYSS